MNIYVTRQIPEIGLEKLRAKGYNLTISSSTVPPTKAELIEAVKGKNYDALLTLLTDTVDAELLDAVGPQLKVVSNYAVGFNNINTDDAAARNVIVTNTPGAFSDCIAEHSVALILALTTRLVEADRYVREGKYKGWDPMIFIGTDLCNKTIGLLGAGHIGERVAYHLNKGFNCKVLYYDVRRNEAIEKDCQAEFRATPEEVLKEADIVSLHVPLLDSTHHLINEARLMMMKPTAILINTSRGPVVDEVALVQALREKLIAGAGIDVYENEPSLAAGLADLPNVVLTPHIASARESARNEMATLAADNIIDVFEGRDPKGKVLIKK
ncbi:MAG: hypothetical protein RL094_218 [Candidatus Parcubacteria bacterium]|jgi:lactate dehydrogenase-like 2-hydroxyacid dehydrogenase